MQEQKTDFFVSVIVPTRNSASFLEPCLKSIRDQAYRCFELIVVDNYSTDRTSQIAQKYADQFLKRGPERSAQRNFGVRHSKGMYVLIIDSDMILNPRVMEGCVERVRNDSRVRAVVIPEVSIGEGFWAKCKALERSCYVGDDSMEAARFFDKGVFEELGGYDENIHGGGEDWDLPERVKGVGHGIGRIPYFIEHMEGNLRLFETMRTKYYYGKTIGLYIRKQPVHAKQKLRLFRPAFFRHRLTLLRHPILSLGMIFMKFCEFLAGGLGSLNSRVKGVQG
ncbi:MAG: glycosyltransferase family 2 protein [Chlamydiae bacterium]|nr:glycosyltransferase family 2 protein [Chlamydiota bacterium]MBI3277327.1 glycosyltransferase family 2 protein [Chlamydiota bacterium]